VQRARLLLAEMKSQSDEPEAAAALVAEVLAADERNADALALRANLRLKAGDYESATADLRAALNEKPQSVTLHQLLAKAFERQGNIDLANDNFVQAVRAANYAPAAALAYAGFLTGRGELARADTILSESLARVPNSTEVIAALGQIRLRQKDWVGAQEAAELLEKLGDRTGASGQILGAALLGQQKFDQSIETLKDAYAATPQAVRPLYSLVAAYVRAGNLDEAKRFLASVLEASPDNADAHVLRGLLHALNDEPEDAAAAYSLAIERQPETPVGYRALANHLIAGDRIEEAEAVLLRGREQAPGDLGLDLFYAGLLERKPDPEGALGVYEDMLRKRPDGLILINNVASLMAEHRSDEASWSAPTSWPCACGTSTCRTSRIRSAGCTTGAANTAPRRTIWRPLSRGSPTTRSCAITWQGPMPRSSATTTPGRNSPGRPNWSATTTLWAKRSGKPSTR
jgi:cellulose synthase operon protein C